MPKARTWTKSIRPIEGGHIESESEYGEGMEYKSRERFVPHGGDKGGSIVGPSGFSEALEYLRKGN